VGVDYTELNRLTQTVPNALDAANFAAARWLAEGATDDQIKAYADDLFNANLNKSTYAAYGYTGVGYNGTSVTRLFGGTSSAIGQFNYSLSNYGSDERADGEAVRQRQGGQHHVMTVALDMSSTDAGDVKAMNALKACPSDSRFRKDPADPTSRPSCSGTRPGRRSPTISRKLRTSCRTCGWWGDG